MTTMTTVAGERQDKLDKLCYLFIIFVTGCLVGWLYEEIFYWLTEGLLRNRGTLYGPWLPIYGVGALGIYAMKPLKKNPVLLFIMCTLITGVVEYVIGFGIIKIFGVKLWDYTGLFLNIHGIICFRSVITFAILGLFFHYILEPMGRKTVDHMGPIIVRRLCFAIGALMLADCLLSALFRTPIMY
ncbi:MAG: putative ABC transporter permease [Lachnospiraceae bacterium]|nr:putative ABC transporter permease [Lachnospiraceae bacterium]